MIKKSVSFALHQPMFMGLMTVLFIAGGIAAFKSLPIEAFPDVSDTQVNVIALYPGRAPEEVEKQVTIPLEVALNGLPHQVRLFSHTQFGLSFIMLTFDEKVTDYFARQQVIERLQGADLPPGVVPHNSARSRPPSAKFSATACALIISTRANCARWKTGSSSASCAWCPALRTS